MFQLIVLMENQFFENDFVSMTIVKGIRDLATESHPFCLVYRSRIKVKTLFLEMRQNRIVNLEQKIGTLGNCKNVPDRVEVDIGFTLELVKMNHARDQKNDKQVIRVILMNVT